MAVNRSGHARRPGRRHLHRRRALSRTASRSAPAPLAAATRVPARSSDDFGHAADRSDDFSSDERSVEAFAAASREAAKHRWRAAGQRRRLASAWSQARPGASRLRKRDRVSAPAEAAGTGQLEARGIPGRLQAPGGFGTTDVRSRPTISAGYFSLYVAPNKIHICAGSASQTAFLRATQRRVARSQPSVMAALHACDHARNLRSVRYEAHRDTRPGDQGSSSRPVSHSSGTDDIPQRHTPTTGIDPQLNPYTPSHTNRISMSQR